MSEHNLSYIDELDESKAKLSKGCIARMVTRRKVEMVSNFCFSTIIFLFTTLTIFYLFFTGKEHYGMWSEHVSN